jgi:hypothetical protein
VQTERRGSVDHVVDVLEIRFVGPRGIVIDERSVARTTAWITVKRLAARSAR